MFEGTATAAEAAAPFRNVRRFKSVVIGARTLEGLDLKDRRQCSGADSAWILPPYGRQNDDVYITVGETACSLLLPEENRSDTAGKLQLLSGGDEVGGGNVAIPQAGIFDRPLLVAEVDEGEAVVQVVKRSR